MILVKTNHPYLRVRRHTECQGKKAMWRNEEGTTATSFHPPPPKLGRAVHRGGYWFYEKNVW
jgi:hypothetical protein